jgi:kynurenine 3-monooxygenase
MRHSDSPKLLEAVLAETIPMYGRMIHGEDGDGNLTEESQQYDVHGRFIRAVDRAALNKSLLDELEGLPNVKLHFRHKLTGVDFNSRKAWFERKDGTISPPQTADAAQADQLQASLERPQEIEVNFDLIFGCDGAHSSVRYHMMKYLRMDYSQTYIDTLWCEFTISPADDANSSENIPSASATQGFLTSPNHLHIWPSSDKMFIAIPSTDKSFTCTLFAPAPTFASLSSAPNPDAAISDFFKENFPGVSPNLISPSALAQQFKSNPHLPLISLKCSPHTLPSGGGVILGDAAHAMLPFYGQGMNAGLEDVRVLFEHIDEAVSKTTPKQQTSSISTALESYTKTRVPDAHTINDLASANYYEMHSGVRSPIYLLRKRIEEFLSDKFPTSGFKTQYARVSFSNERYSLVRKNVEQQGKVLLRGIIGLGLSPFVAWAGWWIWRYERASRTGIFAAKGGIGLGALIGGFGERVGRMFT